MCAQLIGDRVMCAAQVVAVLNEIKVPANCSFQTGLEGSVTTVRNPIADPTSGILRHNGFGQWPQVSVADTATGFSMMLDGCSEDGLSQRIRPRLYSCADGCASGALSLVSRLRCRCHTVLQIAIGHGHAPGTYFLWGLLGCANGQYDLLSSDEDSCSNLYLVR